ncbi:transaldolase, partial [Candidatus Gottesmanbacteria bacterium]|nr:transaldolase [Candidatus Gottesmanbacteria bacterium]
VVRELDIIVDWSVSIEPYADARTSSQEIFEQAKEMSRWTDKAWIKFPTTLEGLKATRQAIKKGIRANMTLCFSQEQAAAVYASTQSKTRSDLVAERREKIFVSPFVGRLDDRGENGMQLIENILKMYQGSDGHVWVLTASVRNINHLFYALQLKSPIITVPFKIFRDWADRGFPIPDKSYQYHPQGLKPIPYKKILLDKPWSEYNLHHELTDIGIDKFSADWNAIVKG